MPQYTLQPLEKVLILSLQGLDKFFLVFNDMQGIGNNSSELCNSYPIEIEKYIK